MKRTPLVASVPVLLAALMTLAGCGSGTSTATGTATVAPQPTVAATTAPAVPPTPAKPGAKVAGIPALSGTPTDLKAQSSAQTGTGRPPTELLTQDVVVGKGAAAKASDTVTIRYSGTLYDGTPFDASWNDGDAPVTYPLEQFVPGFGLGVQGMQPGGRRVLVIPPDLGYGAKGRGPVPGGATIVFVVDLVSVS